MFLVYACSHPYIFYKASIFSQASWENVLHKQNAHDNVQNTADLYFIYLSFINKKVGSCTYFNDNPVVFLVYACSHPYIFYKASIFSQASWENVLHKQNAHDNVQNTADLYFIYLSFINKKVGSRTYSNDNPAVFYFPRPSPAKYLQR